MRNLAALALILVTPWIARAAEPLLSLTSGVEAPAPATGEGDEAEPWSASFYWENDGGYIKPFDRHDRHYTNGLKITFTHQPEWAAQAAEFLPLHSTFDDHLRSAAGYTVGQNMYTPRHFDKSAPITDDRPFAGWLYGGVYVQRDDGRDRPATTLDHFELDLGVIGPWSQADETQTWYHHVVGADKPRGWHNQLGNEVAFDLTWRRKWKMKLWGEKAGFAGELIPQAAATLGTVHRQIEGAGTFRFGWNLPDDFGPGRIDDVSSATGLASRQDQPMGLYFFLRAAGRVVEHNLFLQGSTFRDSLSVDARPLVGEIAGGVVVQFGQHVQLSWVQTYLTDEFYGQDGSDSYGSISLSVFYGF